MFLKTDTVLNLEIKSKVLPKRPKFYSSGLFVLFLSSIMPLICFSNNAVLRALRSAVDFTKLFLTYRINLIELRTSPSLAL